MSELTLVERNDLQYCEQQIEKGLRTFIEVGEALWKIREGKLYRQTHDTFEAYCKERWGFTPRRAQQLMAAGVTMSELEEETRTIVRTESQARELARVEPERRQEVVEQVMSRDGKITAKGIRITAERSMTNEIKEVLNPIEIPGFNAKFWAAISLKANAVANLMRNIHRDNFEENCTEAKRIINQMEKDHERES